MSIELALQVSGDKDTDHNINNYQTKHKTYETSDKAVATIFL